MRNMKTRRVAVPAAVAAFALALVVASTQSRAQIVSTTPTTQQCTDAWDNSSASDTCGWGLDISVSGTACRVQVHCAHYVRVPDPLRPGETVVLAAQRSNDVTGSVTDTGSLQNCDGALKIQC